MRIGVAAALVGGRATFRSTLLIVNVVLLAGWGSTTYSDYAQAMGGATFLTPIASVGIEKCALKLIPRVRHVIGLLVDIYVTLAGLLLLTAMVILAAVLLIGQ